MTPEAERTRAALDDLVRVLEDSGEEVASLLQRTRDLRAQCVQGVLLRDVVPTEPRPLVIQRITALLDVLADAGSALRRAEAQQLRAEGLSQAEIAGLVGVTRQRVAALLAPAPDPAARAAKRPRA